MQFFHLKEDISEMKKVERRVSSISKVGNTRNPEGMTKMRTPEALEDRGATCERGHTANRLSQPLSM